MRILFDQGVPVPLRRRLPDHEIATAYEEGLSELLDRELLQHADSRFEVLVTTDQSLLHQQNLSGLRIGVLVLPTTSWPKLQPLIGRIAATLDRMGPGDRIELSFETD